MCVLVGHSVGNITLPGHAKADIQKSQWTFGWAIVDNDWFAHCLWAKQLRGPIIQINHCLLNQHTSLQPQCSPLSGLSASTQRPPPAPSQPAQASPGNHTRMHSPKCTPTYRHTHTDPHDGSSNPTRASTAASASNSATTYHARPRSRHEGAGTPTSSARLFSQRL